MFYLLKKDFLSIRKEFILFSLLTTPTLSFYRGMSGNISVSSEFLILNTYVLIACMVTLFRWESRKEKGMLLCLGYSKKCQVICRSIYLLLIPCMSTIMYFIISIFLKSFQAITVVEMCFSFPFIMIANGFVLFMYSSNHRIQYLCLFINVFLTITGIYIINKICDRKYEHIQKLLFGNAYRNSVSYLLIGIIILCLYVIITIKIYENSEV